MKRKLRHPKKPLSTSLPSPASTPGSCRTIGELAEQTRQIYLKLVNPKKNQNKYFGKMIAGRGIYSDASKQHTLYLMFEIDPKSKKLGYDLFMQTYCINPSDLSENAFRDSRRAHDFLMKLRDARLRDRLKDISTSVLLRVIPLLDVLSLPVTKFEDIEENIPIWDASEIKLIELYKALLSDQRITVAKMKKLVSDAICNKSNPSITSKLGESEKNLIELCKALFSAKKITLEMMNELVSNIIGRKPNSNITKDTHSKLSDSEKNLIELCKALLSDKEITVEKMKKLVFDIIGPKPNSSIVKGTHSK